LTLGRAHAQEVFPVKTVTIVSPFAPGSAPDVTARLVAPLLSEKWRTPVDLPPLKWPSLTSVLAMEDEIDGEEAAYS
jgi:hypothetical protein